MSAARRGAAYSVGKIGCICVKWKLLRLKVGSRLGCGDILDATKNQLSWCTCQSTGPRQGNLQLSGRIPYPRPRFQAQRRRH